MIDILFVTHNRRHYTQASLAALIENTDWSLVNTLHVFDDKSSDGTYELLDRVLDSADIGEAQAVLLQRAFGGPVAAMNHMLDRTDAEIFAKVDNDLILPPGWLPTMLTVMDNNPALDALGTEPGFASPLQPDYVTRGYQPAPHIGGQGLFRTKAFAKRRPKPHDRYFGMTQFQRRYMKTGWVNPDIASFNLDHLPCEPWRSLAADYVREGWSRAWSVYTDAFAEYWDWWLNDRVVA
jgi:glycosyltransferase involved in cell wall biosynthesis